MRNVAFLTSAELASLTADDRLAIAPLESRGVRVAPAVWTDASVDWSAFDLVVVRSTWDWYVESGRFAKFLAALETRVRVENRGARRWLDKRYLARLAEGGVRTVPTDVVATEAELERALAKYDGTVVLKPATAAGARSTVRFDAGDAARGREGLAAIAPGDVALLQPFVREVEDVGEWSLIFFGGAFSHALAKRPARGDFRVQEEFGGTVEPRTPPADVRAEAERALALAGERFLYARVDGIVSARFGGFCVTELEVVEPELFLRVEPAAPERFASAIAARLEP